MPEAGVNFLGMGLTSSPAIMGGVPPDTTGAVGPNHYVQAVNTGIEVFNKNGTVAKPAARTHTLWAGYPDTDGNHCSTESWGDAIVRYDQLADRWLVAQFDLHQLFGPDFFPFPVSFECVAVSKTGDPTGEYWLYDFKYDEPINDYPKIGVWPDAYYVAYNMFDEFESFLYTKVCAWDRAKMLSGASPTQQCFTTSDPSLLPANLDGSVPPPRGSPELFVALDPGVSPNTDVELWKFHVDWTTPGNSTFTGPTAISVPSYVKACGGGATSCIVEPPPGNSLDSLGDRAMDRLVYRNFGTDEALLFNHTVTAGATAGVRWYEIRSPNATPSLFQSGTQGGTDANDRWMGSIAEDQAGDMALGYSLSGLMTNPSIAWAGRLRTDAPGTMGQGEEIVQTGGGVETGTFHGSPVGRWGDYSNMSVDPSDDCTFWYTNELYPSNGIFNWDTRIASVKFPNCGANDFSISAAPGSASVQQGNAGSITIDTASTKGAAESLTLNLNNLPAGVTPSFAPSPVTAGGSSTLSLNIGLGAVPGTYPVTVIGTGASAYHATTFELTITPAPPPPPPPVKCVVPNLSGLTLTDAQAALTSDHCSLGAVQEAFSATIPKGRIISQSVPPATELDNGAAVNVVASLGRKPVPKKVTLCYRHHTVKVTKKVAKRLLKHGAKRGACKKRRTRR